MNITCTTAPMTPIQLAVCALTHVAALAAAVIGQTCTRGIVATNHASIVVDDSIQVIAGELLLLLTNTELAQVQVPVVPPREVRQLTGAQDAYLRPHALPIVMGAHCSPNRELHQVIDLVTPDETAEGEALELHNEHIGQAPQQQLLGGLTVLFALRAVPERGKGWGQDQQISTRPCHTTCLMPSSPSLLRRQHLRPCEEVQALVQSKVASTGSLTSRAWILSTFQLL